MIPPRLRAGLVLAVVVLASALAGAAIDRAFITRRPAYGGSAGGSPGGGGSGRSGGYGGRGGPDGGGPGRGTPEQEARRRTAMLDRLDRDLALTAPQRAGIDSIMQRTDSSLRAIRREMHPRLQQVFQSSRAEIASRLTPEQREKFARRPDRSRGRR